MQRKAQRRGRMPLPTACEAQVFDRVGNPLPTSLLAGVPVHVVAARLGHADPSVTLRVYAHVVRDQVAAAADIFARSIPAGDGPAVSKSVSKSVAAEGRNGC
jgi:integrase